MSNIRKSFNFRNGVQVDDDNFVVNSIGNVGIGTTIPSETLDVIGNVKISGILTATISKANSFESNSLSVSSISLTDSIIGSGVSIRSGVITDTGSGIVTYYGDGRFLQGLPTSQWIDVDVGLGFTSIYNVGYVGVSTNDPRYNFQVGGTNNLGNFLTGVGIDDVGNIVATGIVTANKFAGIGSNLTQLNASSIDYGTISNDRLPVLLNSKLPSNISVSGIITATSGFVGDITGDVTGNLAGTATTATNLEDASNITAGIISNDRIPDIVESNIYVTSGVSTFNNVNASTITASLTGTATTAASLTGSPNITVNSIGASDLTSGIITATTEFNVGTNGSSITALSDAKLGIGTQIPTSELQIRRPVSATLEIIGETGESKISFGKLVGGNDDVGVLRYGNPDKTLDIINFGKGDINSYLDAGPVGVDTGRFNWIYGQTNEEVMSLTYEGKLGIGVTNPFYELHVVGTSTITSNLYIGDDLYVDGNLTVNGTLFLPDVVESNINVTSGISTFNDVNIASSLFVSKIGIGSDNPSQNIDAQSSTALVQGVGIGTTNLYGGVVGAYGNVVINGGLGINTDYFDPSGASLQLYAPLTELTEGHINLKPNSTVGFDTSDPKAVFDFSNVGAATTRPVIVVPNIDNTVITGIAETPAGSVIFNTTTSKFQGYTGTAWVDFH